jgi:hypothetical protein
MANLGTNLSNAALQLDDLAQDTAIATCSGDKSLGTTYQWLTGCQLSLQPYSLYLLVAHCLFFGGNQGDQMWAGIRIGTSAYIEEAGYGNSSGGYNSVVLAAKYQTGGSLAYAYLMAKNTTAARGVAVAGNSRIARWMVAQ